MASRNMMMIPPQVQVRRLKKKAGARRLDQVSPILGGKPDHNVLMTLGAGTRPLS
jgi:hypothetical protein